MKNCSRLLMVLWVLGSVYVPVVFAENDDSGSVLVEPWELAHRKPADSFWAPLLRLQYAELDYRESNWWGYYVQIRAGLEATAGNHDVALQYWDEGRPAGNSTGVPLSEVHAVDALEFLGAVADTARVLMINERHHAASDRLLTHRLLRVLRDKGFNYFAAEAFGYVDSTLNERKYPVENTGTYTTEPVFAEVIREALRLGYTLVPYEVTQEQGKTDANLTSQQFRDKSQAQNLYDRIFRDDPNAKVLVHAGFSHILEEVNNNWYPMALYFHEISGINPVTIDQTKMSERSTPEYEHPAYRTAIAEGLLSGEAVILVDATGQPFSAAAFAVDIQVLTPRTKYSGGRPEWMTFGGSRNAIEIEIPECRNRRCFVEARIAGEPPEAIPLDRSETLQTGSVKMFLPPDEAVQIHVFAENGDLLRSFEYITDALPNDE